ncbi:serine/threonine protein kinase [Actinomadura keratinilytica]
MAPVVSPDGSLSSPPTGVAAGGSGRSGRSARGSVGSARGSGSARTAASSGSRSSRRSVSGQLSRSQSGRATTRSVSVRSSASNSSSQRGRLGAGLVAVPDVPRPDPRTAVAADPRVPERKRFCSRAECGAPVGRSRGERPGRTEGFCTSAATRTRSCRSCGRVRWCTGSTRWWDVWRTAGSAGSTSRWTGRSRTGGWC